jgi:hypothetical protein
MAVVAVEAAVVFFHGALFLVCVDDNLAASYS